MQNLPRIDPRLNEYYILLPINGRSAGKQTVSACQKKHSARYFDTFKILNSRFSLT